MTHEFGAGDFVIARLRTNGCYHYFLRRVVSVNGDVVSISSPAGYNDTAPTTVDVKASAWRGKVVYQIRHDGLTREEINGSLARCAAGVAFDRMMLAEHSDALELIDDLLNAQVGL